MQRPVSISESPSVTAQEAEYAEKKQQTVVCCFGKQGMRDVYVGGKGL